MKLRCILHTRSSQLFGREAPLPAAPFLSLLAPPLSRCGAVRCLPGSRMRRASVALETFSSTEKWKGIKRQKGLRGMKGWHCATCGPLAHRHGLTIQRFFCNTLERAWTLQPRGRWKRLSFWPSSYRQVKSMFETSSKWFRHCCSWFNEHKTSRKASPASLRANEESAAHFATVIKEN